MKLNSYLIAGFLFTNLVACDKEEEKSDTASETVALAAVDDSAVANIGALAIGSIGPAGFGFTGETSLKLNEEDGEDGEDGDSGPETQSTRDANCGNNGSPFKNGVELNPGDAEYASRKLYCASVFDTVSPDSAMGAMTIASMFTCELKKEGVWSEDAFTAEGNEIASATVTPSLDCLEQYQVTSITEMGPSYELTFSHFYSST